MSERTSYKKSIKLLQLAGIEFEAGLTDNEVTKIEKIYNIQFPKSLKNFLMEGLPISKGFYNWRNFEPGNIEYIRHMIFDPMKYIDNFAEEVYWCDEWGKEPECVMDKAQIVRARLKNAPILLPIFAHRYMPEISNDRPPVISVHGVDIIYYGEDLEDYFKIEFGKKEQSEINFQRINTIPFWSEIM